VITCGAEWCLGRSLGLSRGIFLSARRGKQTGSVVMECCRQLTVNRTRLLEPANRRFVRVSMIRPGFASLSQGNLGPNLQQDQFRKITPQGDFLGFRQSFIVRG
jgi:hypothetical protein